MSNFEMPFPCSVPFREREEVAVEQCRYRGANLACGRAEAGTEYAEANLVSGSIQANLA